MRDALLTFLFIGALVAALWVCALLAHNDGFL
jgi:hypothetical protein